MREQEGIRLGYEEQQVFDVNTDAELKALITACVQAAKKRNLKKGELYTALTEVWNELKTSYIHSYYLPTKKLSENEDQKEFRKKAEKFFDEFPEHLIRETINPLTRKEYTVNFWCAIYRMISEGQNITGEAIQAYLKDCFYLYDERIGRLERYNFTEIVAEVFRHCSSKFSSLAMIKTNGATVNFKATKSSDIEKLYETDFSVSPKHYRGRVEIEGYKKLSEMIEPKEFIAELFPGKAKTCTRVKVGEVIWLIKNFF